jgi:hypothetical protein
MKPIFKHNNPSDYGLTQEEAWKYRLRYLKARLEAFRGYSEAYRVISLAAKSSERWIPEMYRQERQEVVDRLLRDVSYITRLLKGEITQREMYDLEYIKQIPITNFVEVNRAGFFKLRDEKTPSCKYYEKTNTWHDFGSGEHGSNVDLVMKIYQCSFVEALKMLSTM